MKTEERLIVALDHRTAAAAKQTVEELGEAVSWYKVGLELYYAAGNDLLLMLKQRKKKIFLDLKLHDIPNTVAHSLAVLTELGVDMLNVHAGGGAEMMKAAINSVQNKADELKIKRPKLIAVTVLTSMDEKGWQDLHYVQGIGAQVLSLATLAADCGLDGVVASPREAAAIRAACGKDFLIVTPGVRPAGSSANDQSRIATPRAALVSGATQLVIGRPITEAADKKTAAECIIAEMRGI